MTLLIFDPTKNEPIHLVLSHCTHWRWKEFRCRCKLHNKMTDNECCKVDSLLVEGLENLRALINKVKGPKPNGREWTLTIEESNGSAYRCPVHNKAVGGVSNSAHVKGMAADINCPGLGIDELAKFAEQVPQFKDGGIGRYYSQHFVHVDVLTTPKKGRRWVTK